MQPQQLFDNPRIYSNSLLFELRDLTAEHDENLVNIRQVVESLNEAINILRDYHPDQTELDDLQQYLEHNNDYSLRKAADEVLMTEVMVNTLALTAQREHDSKKRKRVHDERMMQRLNDCMDSAQVHGKIFIHTSRRLRQKIQDTVNDLMY